jgi:hypothetical protein
VVSYSRVSNAVYYFFDDRLLDDGVEFVEVNMSVICNICGKVKDHGVQVIRGKDNFVMVCDECYMDGEGYMEEMRGCGCGGQCD